MPRPENPEGIARRGAVIPGATYRIQLNANFTFKQATAIIPYLASLGISHLYCSPYFRARAGSMHGYDVVDHNSLNPEIGDRADFEEFVATLRRHAMGHILDIVPNHVGIMGADNAWWMDVLENGQLSQYADFFDIDWAPANPALTGRILVPVLGDPYGVVLERGELQLRFEPQTGSFAVYYHEHRFPLDPRTYPRVLTGAVHRKLDTLRRSFAELPDRSDEDGAQIEARHQEKEAHKQALAALCREDGTVTDAIEQALRSFRGDPQEPASFDALDELLDAQAYRLAYWRVASDEINYRRFFDVNSLAALRVENEPVFEATHQLLLELIGEGKIDGLRVDHPDGLYDPAGYCRRLQQRVATVLGLTDAAQTDGALPNPLPTYLVVEKITASFEHLPSQWPVHGETGYHFANVVNRLLIDAATRSRMDRIYRNFSGYTEEWPNITYLCQYLVLRNSLAAELNVIANQLSRIAQADRRTRDFSLNSLRHALGEVIASFPVYRTYITATVSEDDRRYIDWAVRSAKRRSSASEAKILDFVRDALLLELPAANDRIRARIRAFSMKFQQITAPVKAKGVEDTALYRFNRFVSLNEVGGEPDLYGASVRAFHTDSQYRARYWPHEMLTTSTHDTKRSEDVRARISVLSETTAQWRRAIDRWSRMNRTRKKTVDGQIAPSRNDEYLFYQTLLGSWPQQPDPAYRERLEGYLIKAVREAKLRSSWANINTEYEDSLTQFVRAVLEPREGNLFLADFSAFQQRLARFGLYNGLSQTLCKLTAPGVPDIYQGNEVWDFSLVDPDNRRPVDYAHRAQLLEELRARDRQADDPDWIRSLVANIEDGRCKLLLTWKALQFRRAQERLFRDGEYLPLRVSGRHASNLCAFARRDGRQCALTLAPRLYLRLLGERGDQPPLGLAIWEDTCIELPRGLDEASRIQNVLDGSEVSLTLHGDRLVVTAAAALHHFPVALLAIL